MYSKIDWRASLDDVIYAPKRRNNMRSLQARLWPALAAVFLVVLIWAALQSPTPTAGSVVALPAQSSISRCILHSAPSPTEQPSKWFPDVVKTVRGDFLLYLNDLAHGGIARLGNPVSDDLSETSPVDGNTYRMQYFKYSALELHQLASGPKILLSLLGTFRYQEKYPTGAADQVPNTEPASIVFPETNKRLGGDFLAYWRANGQLEQFGFPITDEFPELSEGDGITHTVQYFQRAVFEWHPDSATARVVLLPLGEARYRAQYPYAPIPDTLPKPSPQATALVLISSTCGPFGSLASTDPNARLNELKNRVDTAAAWQPVDVRAILDLSWPTSIQDKARARWTPTAAAEVARFEGSPVQVEGWLVGANRERDESPNCGRTDPAGVDYHLWFTDDLAKDRSQSMVIEVAPRVRALHPMWDIDRICRQVVNSTREVRISGWLMMDQEHHEQLVVAPPNHQVRETLWEIHPIMGFEVLTGTTWVDLATLP
jgi:hypothetical protein